MDRSKSENFGNSFSHALTAPHVYVGRYFLELLHPADAGLLENYNRRLQQNKDFYLLTLKHPFFRRKTPLLLVINT